MNPRLERLDPAATDARRGFEKVVLRLVKGSAERVAIEAGQIDAVIDTTNGKAILLPDAQRAVLERKIRLRSLLALCCDWTWEQDEHHRFAAGESTGGAPTAFDLAHLIGKALWELPFDNMTNESDWEVHRRQLQWRAAFHNLELRYADSVSDARWISLDGEPVFDAEEQFRGYRGTARDITVRKHAEAAREASTRFVEAAEEESRATAEPLASSQSAAGNRVLASLPAEEYRRLLVCLEPVRLTFGEALYEPGAPIRHVYFPIDCVISLMGTLDDHPALEVGLIGHEGMAGIALALGIEVSMHRAVVQAAGTALRVESTAFRSEFLRSKGLQQALFRYKHALAGQLAQSVACHHFHSVPARFASYLLMTSDRAASRSLSLTQEFLAYMLGVRRVGVSNAAGAMQKRKLIRYRRGEIKILDRKRLAESACECYRVIKRIHA